MEESLFVYGIVRNPLIDTDNFNTLLCVPSPTDINDYIFQWESIYKENIKKAINNINDRFFDFIGESKESYLKALEETNDISYFIQTISQWDSILYEHDYHLDICDVIQALLHEESERVKIDKTYQVKHNPVIIL